MWLILGWIKRSEESINFLVHSFNYSSHLAVVQVKSQMTQELLHENMMDTMWMY